MKNLTEAINHCIEKANKLGDCECAKDHLQLTEWLIDLKNLMENGYAHFCKKIDDNYKIFVAASLQGLCTSNTHLTPEEIAIRADVQAKAMIRQLKCSYPYE